MADADHTKDDDHKADQGGSGGDQRGKASGSKGGGGNRVGTLLRNPITWAIAGVGALLVAVFAGGVPIPTVGTAPSSNSPSSTAPSSYGVSDSSGVADGSSPSARRSVAGQRLGARTCVSIVQRARADYGRDWESELSHKERADCGRAIQEARRADLRSPQQAEGPRGRQPGAGDVEVQRMNVAYGDLDLTTSTGAERFLERLKSAAIRVCGGQPDIRELEARRAFKDCVDRNMDSAVAQLRAPRVTALHQRAG